MTRLKELLKRFLEWFEGTGDELDFMKVSEIQN